MTANPGDIPDSQPRPRGRVPADTLANRLLLARRMNGLTIKQAAELIQVEDERDMASSWSNWENGRKPRDEVETIRAIAIALDVDQEWLMFGGPLSPAARPSRHGVSKRPGEDTLRYHSMALGPAQTTQAYRPVADRPRSTRPPGHAATIGRTSGETGQRTTHPGGPENRRPRRLKYPSAA